MVSVWRRRVASLLLGLCVCSGLGLGWGALAVSRAYDVSVSDAASNVVTQVALVALRAAAWIYDPFEPLLAQTGPAPTAAHGPSFVRLEALLPPGSVAGRGSGVELTASQVNNPRIVRGRFNFDYQPFDEPALHELRRAYRLDEVVRSATNDFEAMVLLRNWTRSRFRRSDYQVVMANFNALDLLRLDSRNHGEPYAPDRHYDPCHLFPILYAQVVASMGYQARLVSVSHGMAEVWSNHYRKWIVMDVELNHHYEKMGVPLNMAEMLDEYFAPRPTHVEVVRGEQSSGDANTTMVYLGMERLRPEDALELFDLPLDIVDMRNDWMTNHYVPGHPRRSEANSLVLVDPRTTKPLVFRQRLRPVTTDRADFYWTLNETEIFAHRAGVGLSLMFKTVTPNFDHFEIIANGTVTTQSEPFFAWQLHDGANVLTVRSVNKFGVKGIDSSATVLARYVKSEVPAHGAQVTR
jgi:hypothetical protein